MAKVILVCGGVAAGKSTLCHTLSKELNAITFSIDDWMTQLFLPDLDGQIELLWMSERLKRCESQIWKHALELIHLGVNVILEISLTTKIQRESCYTMLRKSAIEFKLFYLEVPKSIRFARLQIRNQQKGPHYKLQVTSEMFEYIDKVFEAPSEKELIHNYGKRLN